MASFLRNPAFLRGAAHGLYEAGGDPFGNPILAAILSGREFMDYELERQAEEQERRQIKALREAEARRAEDRIKLERERFEAAKKDAEAAQKRRLEETKAAAGRKASTGNFLSALLTAEDDEERRALFGTREPGPWRDDPNELDPSDLIALYKMFNLDARPQEGSKPRFVQRGRGFGAIDPETGKRLWWDEEREEDEGDDLKEKRQGLEVLMSVTERQIRALGDDHTAAVQRSELTKRLAQLTEEYMALIGYETKPKVTGLDFDQAPAAEPKAGTRTIAKWQANPRQLRVLEDVFNVEPTVPYHRRAELESLVTAANPTATRAAVEADELLRQVLAADPSLSRAKIESAARRAGISFRKALEQFALENGI